MFTLNFLYPSREERGVSKFLATAQYNRGRPRSPSPPKFPEEMMGKDREIKVSQQLEKYLFTLGVVQPQSSIKGVPPAERASVASE